jgi:RNA polymerase sigma-70 factor (ECF subfamily)
VKSLEGATTGHLHYVSHPGTLVAQNYWQYVIRAATSQWLMGRPAPRLRIVGKGRTDEVGLGGVVARAARGDRSAQEELYRAHAPAVLGLATRLLGRRSDAEDAAQDTFVIAFENIRQLRDPGALRSWIMQIAVSQVRRRFRKRSLLRALGLHMGVDDATLESLVSPGASPETNADLAALDRALGALPAGPRLAWMLRYVEGEELEAVARACDCSLATVKRRIALADAVVRAEVRLGGERP